MTDYMKLVKALRFETDYVAVEKTMLDAAAAIEALQAEVDEQKQITAHYEQTAKDYWKEACEYHAIVSAKDITAKESEELIRKFKKLPCGPIEPNEPKRGEWELIDGAEPMRWGCSRCKYMSWDTSNYCPRCGAKMEVQDGQ